MVMRQAGCACCLGFLTYSHLLSLVLVTQARELGLEATLKSYGFTSQSFTIAALTFPLKSQRSSTDSGIMRTFALVGSVAALLIALCAATPEAKPEAKADPMPQFNNNAPFSGAIYLVNTDGQQVTVQDTNYCPSSASQSCSSINAPSW